jgi:glycosyltransferase involved in cell wall biosynthesis
MTATSTLISVNTPRPAQELPRLVSPKISVLICNYNYERYLAAAIESALEQTRPADEIIFVDDGSTDGSRELARSFEPRGVKLVFQDNGGQVAAYNRGFAHATGDVILFLDSDDILLPRALERIATRFAAGVAKVHFQLQLITSDGKRLKSVLPRKLAKGSVAARFLQHGIPHSSPPASGNAFRRDVLQRIFPLPTDEYDRHGADFFCIYGATLFGDIAACDEPLGLYRVHAESRTDASLTFGNAEKQYDTERLLKDRLLRFRRWIAERSQGRISGPSQFLDFSIEKTSFAHSRLAGNGRMHDLRGGLAKWQRLLKAIYLREEYSTLKKLGLCAWSVLVWVAPRPIALRAARYVCNPATRG